MAAAPQLSVRSARARELAHELSRIERRPIHMIVEEALESYAARNGRTTNFKDFLARMQELSWEGEPDEPNFMEAVWAEEVPERTVEF